MAQPLEKCSKADVAAWAKRIKVEPADFRKRVVVHELRHLKVPNHGKLFRSFVRAYLGTSEVDNRKTSGDARGT
ncbi:MAG: DUF45 domain-containing protein [Gemmataceae bacterium]|nr:DUF45 domain-containing protein [Gemmataceae bacterium]